jgi:hypothetical protein
MVIYMGILLTHVMLVNGVMLHGDHFMLPARGFKHLIRNTKFTKRKIIALFLETSFHGLTLYGISKSITLPQEENLLQKSELQSSREITLCICTE